MTASVAVAHSRPTSRRNPLGRYSPKNFGPPSRWRFRRDRRSSYLARIVGELTDYHAATIESLIALEWAALCAEAEGDIQAMREAPEHRRLFQRLLSDFERSAREVVKPRAPTLAEVLAEATAARQRGAAA
jgi:hypothetical protein